MAFTGAGEYERMSRDVKADELRCIGEDGITGDLKEFYRTPRQMIYSFLDYRQDKIMGMIIKGGAGLGKSWLCMDIFNEKGWERDREYAVLSGYITPLELFVFLYKNRDREVILFDDAVKMFDNELSRGLLLSALWGTKGERAVSYLSSSDKLVDEDGVLLPRTFLLRAKVLWLLNDLPMELGNIKSRCYFYEIEFDYEARIKIIYEICRKEGIPIEIADFIRDNTNEAYEIDFRLPLKLFGFYKTLKEEWTVLAKAILKPDEDLQVIRELLLKGMSVSRAVHEYINKTGHSRATFFRKKKLIKGISSERRR